MEDESLDEIYYFLMERLMRKAREVTKLRFAEFGNPVTVDQWIIIKKIAEKEGISQREVSDETFKEPAAITRSLDILDKKALIERRAVKGDRRKYQLYLTSGGKKLYQQLLPAVIDIRQTGLRDLSENDRTMLKEFLRKIYHNLETY
ncbi:MarR family winged helix-turn-helix transcriptional regulator [Tunicatimonas pelagia]|uniref:MarR family winged helix-turn-helix transcriptional regulator n=1 Tax=Tunicatimonas pelagia TaxID=931531 RepID=UPI002666C172|nr:MarR family transcriptional regulator [Tunicatimonas pelagia]WKN44531.1 MarR family transcriptional regulator [Tunicatimonas pelagia]